MLPGTVLEPVLYYSSVMVFVPSQFAIRAALGLQGPLRAPSFAQSWRSCGEEAKRRSSRRSDVNLHFSEHFSTLWSGITKSFSCQRLSSRLAQHGSQGDSYGRNRGVAPCTMRLSCILSRSEIQLKDCQWLPRTCCSTYELCQCGHLRHGSL
jgi:hypothetical protein